MDISPKKKKEDEDDTKELPLELESNILARLSTKEVVRCECICKRWRDEIIRSPNFIECHTRRNDEDKSRSGSVILYPKIYPKPSSTKAYSMDVDQLLLLGVNGKKEEELRRRHCLPTKLYTYAELIGSSKGLVCFRNMESNDMESLRFWLHNPATGCCSTVPRLFPTKAQPLKVSLVKMMGFGYDSKTDDFKILCSLTYTTAAAVRDDEYHVYSLKSGSWKYIEPCLVGGAVSRFRFTQVDPPCVLTLSNNALHFMASVDDRAYGIYAFDLGTEEFRQVPPIPGCFGTPCLFDIKGCLHATLLNSNPRRAICYRPNIWVLDQSNWCWTKLVDLDAASLAQQVKLDGFLKLWPLAYSYSQDNGSHFLLGVGFTGLYISAILRYHLHPDGHVNVQSFTFRRRSQIMPWTPSLRNPALLISSHHSSL